MKILKWSSFFLLPLILMGVFAPQLSAKHHKSRSTSFSLNFNLQPATPRVYEYRTVSRPAYCERVTVVKPYAPTPYYAERIYYPYREEVVVERPAYSVYVHPQYSYWGY